MPEDLILEEKKALMEQVMAKETEDGAAPDTERALFGDDEIKEIYKDD